MKTLKLLVLICTFTMMVQPLKAIPLGLCDSVPGNLVANCGFETGDFTGWTVVDSSYFTYVASNGFWSPLVPNSGDYYAALGAVSYDGTLSQTFTTSVGADYTFAFYLASEGDDPSDFSAYWDGTPLLSLTDPNSNSAYTPYTYSVIGTGLDTIQFNSLDDIGYMALDDISVSDVPEPGAFSLLFLGLGLGIAIVGRQYLHA
jgi:hypothetical protein